jgi:3-methyladenine DNA glycosylase/8-oxoguanine DNA glycosylase
VRRDALGRVEVRREVRPRWVFRLPSYGTQDGLVRCRDGVLERVLHVEDEPAVVRVAQPGAGRVLLGARAASAEVAEEAIARMRFALGVDDDLRPFYERFRDDPLIGPSVRARPWVRPRRRPEPFEALYAAVTEQLIEVVRAVAIQRRIIAALGREAPGWDGRPRRDAPTAAAVAGCAPARFEAWDLAPKRALTLRRAAREVALGRVDLRDPDHERGWRRLRAIHGIGSWTVEVTAYLGQGRHDQLCAGDLAYVKLVGAHLHGPGGRATEEEVREFFAPYLETPWGGLCGTHALRAGTLGVAAGALAA